MTSVEAYELAQMQVDHISPEHKESACTPFDWINDILADRIRASKALVLLLRFLYKITDLLVLYRSKLYQKIALLPLI